MVKTKKLRNFEFGNHTDKGLVRAENEDYLGYFETINGHLFVVCDGMGGAVGGSVASRLAVDCIRIYLENEFFDDPQIAVHNALLFANGQIYENAIKNPDLQGMGTTCLLVLIRDNTVYYGHVGDSRIYLFASNKLYRLTKDHSVVEDMLSNGLISEEEAFNHPRKNEILQALGVKAHIEPSLALMPYKPVDNDILLLCTDGLTGMVKEKHIKRVLDDNMPLQSKAMRLVRMANEAGGTDNTTVQLIQFYNLSNTHRDFVPLNVNEEPETTTHEPVSGKIGALLNYRPWVKPVVFALAGLFLLYMVYDLFFRNPVKEINKVQTQSQQEANKGDSAKASQNQAPVVAPPSQNKAENKAPRDSVYQVKSGETWATIYSKFGVCSWFIKTHPENKKQLTPSGDPREKAKLHIPLKYSSKASLNPLYYKEFVQDKIGGACSNVDQKFKEQVDKKMK